MSKRLSYRLGPVGFSHSVGGGKRSRRSGGCSLGCGVVFVFLLWLGSAIGIGQSLSGQSGGNPIGVNAIIFLVTSLLLVAVGIGSRS